MAAFIAAFVLTALRLGLDVSAGGVDPAGMAVSLVMMTCMLTAATLFTGPFWLLLAPATAALEGLRALRLPALWVPAMLAGGVYGYLAAAAPALSGVPADATEPVFQVVSWALGGAAYWWVGEWGEGDGGKRALRCEN